MNAESSRGIAGDRRGTRYARQSPGGYSKTEVRHLLNCVETLLRQASVMDDVSRESIARLLTLDTAGIPSIYTARLNGQSLLDLHHAWTALKSKEIKE